MSKTSDNRVSIETWMVQDKKNRFNKGGKRPVEKIAVRNSLGQFHGATNFRGSERG